VVKKKLDNEIQLARFAHADLAGCHLKEHASVAPISAMQQTLDQSSLRTAFRAGAKFDSELASNWLLLVI